MPAPAKYCNLCKAERLENGHKMRPLKSIQGMPNLRLCTYCDGDAYELASKNAAKNDPQR